MDTGGSYLVTGAAGFIGSHLCELLLSRGAAVVAVDNLDAHGPYPVHFKEANLEVLRACAATHAASGASLRFVRADVSDATAASALFRLEADRAVSKPVTRVCHLGARSGVAASFDDAAGVVNANVGSTAALLAAAAEFGVDAFVLGSSGSVYGDGARDPARGPTASRETDATDDPESPYAASKRAAELVCAAFGKRYGATIRRVTVCRIFTVYGDGARDPSRGPRASRETDATDDPESPYAASKRAAELVCAAFGKSRPSIRRVTACRIFTTYGERGRPDMAVFRFVRASLRGETLFRFGDGESSWRDYAHVEDVALGLFEAMHRDDDSGAAFEAVNVASGVPTRLRRLIETVASACGGDPAAVEERPPRPGDVGGTFADVAAAEEILGWRAEIGLREGVARTAAWYASPASEPWRDPTPRRERDLEETVVD